MVVGGAAADRRSRPRRCRCRRRRPGGRPRQRRGAARCRSRPCPLLDVAGCVPRLLLGRLGHRQGRRGDVALERRTANPSSRRAARRARPGRGFQRRGRRRSCPRSAGRRARRAARVRHGVSGVSVRHCLASPSMGRCRQVVRGPLALSGEIEPVERRFWTNVRASRKRAGNSPLSTLRIRTGIWTSVRGTALASPGALRESGANQNAEALVKAARAKPGRTIEARAPSSSRRARVRVRGRAPRVRAGRVGRPRAARRSARACGWTRAISRWPRSSATAPSSAWPRSTT